MKNINFKKVLLVLGVGIGVVTQVSAFDHETCYFLEEACLGGIERACEIYNRSC
jgi:hypothetical protein